MFVKRFRDSQPELHVLCIDKNTSRRYHHNRVRPTNVTLFNIHGSQNAREVLKTKIITGLRVKGRDVTEVILPKQDHKIV